MRIAQIATAWESIPPQGYGGIERVIYYLVEELVQQGHDVTLFASGDSHTSARLVPICERAVRPAPDLHDAAPFHVSGCARAMAQADEFSIPRLATASVLEVKCEPMPAGSVGAEKQHDPACARGSESPPASVHRRSPCRHPPASGPA